MINTWSIYAFRPTEVLAVPVIPTIQPVIAAALAVRNFIRLGETQQHIHRLQEIGLAAAQVCDDEAPAARRMTAAKLDLTRFR